MITELLLQQFKAHADTRVPIGRFTVLVGPNAVGKTSVLEALLLLNRLLDGARSPRQVFQGKHDLRWLVRRGATQEMKIEARGETASSTWAYLVTVPASADPDKIVTDWTDRVRPRDPEEEKAIEQIFGDALRKQRSPAPPEGTQVLRNAVALSLEARHLAAPSYSEDEVPRLGRDGFGLATTLATLKLADTATFQKLESVACAIVPGLQKIGFQRTKLDSAALAGSNGDRQNGFSPVRQTLIADELVLDFKDAAGLPGHAASEGTLLVLGILCAIYGPSRPKLLLLDDIDRALHPKAQRELLAGLRAALDAAPDLQIVATTHSPYLVDALDRDQVVMLARRSDGAVAAKRMSEHPKIDMLDVLTTGELWTAEGEDWVAQP